MYKAVFFDLDNTLEYFSERLFIETFIKEMSLIAQKGNFDHKLFCDTVNTATWKIFENDGSKLNRDAFWNYFYSIFPDADKKKTEKLFLDFYASEFNDLCLKMIKPNKLAKSIIDFANANFELVGLTTNPVFPSIAVEDRMRVSSLSKDDFDFITTYDNSSFCKPNPGYFQEILKRYDLKGEEVIMVGNNVHDDCFCAEQAGIKTTFLIGEELILSDTIKDHYDHIKNEDVINHLKELLKQ